MGADGVDRALYGEGVPDRDGMGRVRAGDGAGEVVPGCAHRISPPPRGEERRGGRDAVWHADARFLMEYSPLISRNPEKPSAASRGSTKFALVSDSVSRARGLSWSRS